ncbi:MAG: type II toxin-antitoxin system prevent-host-death family antitoxin [Gloeobacteraceae cyanobacterium ES-bin-144]|nr:type II toxin-antitoxin system prevent-host-death family antitoxin [Verrucomicrobiales bacterium]
MRTATVRDLRNHYTSLLRWVSAGEEVIITQRGKPVARLIPEKPKEPEMVDWGNAPEVTRNRNGERMLSAQESLDLIHDAASKW